MRAAATVVVVAVKKQRIQKLETCKFLQKKNHLYLNVQCQTHTVQNSAAAFAKRFLFSAAILRTRHTLTTQTISRSTPRKVPVRVHLAGVDVRCPALDERDGEVADSSVHAENVTVFHCWKSKTQRTDPRRHRPGSRSLYVFM